MTAAFWLSLCNFWGAVFYTLAGVAGLFGWSSKWLVDLPYLLGSLLFMVRGANSRRHVRMLLSQSRSP